MEKGQFFQIKLKLEGNRLKKDTKHENFKEDLIRSIDTNHQINMILFQAIHRLKSI